MQCSRGGSSQKEVSYRPSNPFGKACGPPSVIVMDSLGRAGGTAFLYKDPGETTPALPLSTPLPHHQRSSESHTMAIELSHVEPDVPSSKASRLRLMTLLSLYDLLPHSISRPPNGREPMELDEAIDLETVRRILARVQSTNSSSTQQQPHPHDLDANSENSNHVCHIWFIRLGARVNETVGLENPCRSGPFEWPHQRFSKFSKPEGRW